jgi:hypothetical protein
MRIDALARLDNRAKPTRPAVSYRGVSSLLVLGSAEQFAAQTQGFCPEF